MLMRLEPQDEAESRETDALGIPVNSSLAHSSIKYGSVGEEKELGNEILPDLDARPSDA
jgi:hypothetical protein